MTLTHSVSLFGLAAAITPIIIYLLLRRRKTEVPWGASYLLRLTLRSKRKSSIWKQLVVLAIRASIIALGAALLTLPLLRNPKPEYVAPAMPPSAVHRVVLMDNSLSMSVTDEAGSRIRRLRNVVEALLRSQRKGDSITLITLLRDRGAVNRKCEPLRGTLDERKMRRVLATVVPREGSVSLYAPLAGAVSQLNTTRGTSAEIYILSDFPRELADDVERLGWFREAARKREARVVPVSMAPPKASQQRNIVIERVFTGSDLAIVGVPITVYVEATNYADQETMARFELLVDERPAAREDVALKANEKKRFAVSLNFEKAGGVLLAVKVDQSGLEIHRQRHLSLRVRDKVTLWVVTDGETSPAASSGDALEETELLLRALRRKKALEIVGKKMFDLTKPIPEEVDLVLIASSQYALSAASAPLASFVKRGGGLVLAMSDEMSIEGYNAAFSEFLPSPLTHRVNESPDPENFSLPSAEPAAGASPLLWELAAVRESDWTDVRLYNYMLLEERDPGEGIVFRLNNADPLLLHRQIGRGHFYLLASSLGVSWSSMPVRQCFIPFLVRLSQASMNGRVFPRNLAPGESLVMPWPRGETVKVIAPDLAERSAELVKGKKGRFVVLPDLRDRGLYRLEDEGGHAEHATVVGAPHEGDLRTLPEEQAARLSELLGAPIYSDWPTAVKALGASDESHRVWPWLLGLMVLLYLFETWFLRYV